MPSLSAVALMNVVQQKSHALPSVTLKMEERKRAAATDHEEHGPPLKKQSTSVNGTHRSHQYSDMPGQDDLEVIPPPLALPLHPTLTRLSPTYFYTRQIDAY